MPADPQDQNTNPAGQTTGRTLDHAAPVYDLLAPLMTFGLERGYRRRARALLQLQGNEQVLDVGCGTGTLSREIARDLNPGQSKVVGVDAAAAMIDVARRKGSALSNLRFDAALAEQLPYDDHTFDCAVSTFFFHHIEFTLKQRALAELRRTVKPGGRIVIVDVDVPSNPFGALCAWSGYWLFRQEEIR
jgi:demethylmenaquinone methyltransferase/2-methoxy-6-polyprenyl-1,4-benzoquinol methylase/phosphoethanolamine N-methyltransferase